MTLYARSDLASVFVPAEGFGGCANLHSRPVTDGAPAKVWALDCPPCEDHLRSDPHWSATLSEIPETFDESKAREDFDKRGARDRDQVLTLALAKLAGVELPETLMRPVTGNMPHVPLIKVACPAGHENAPGMKFCGECGTPMHSSPPPAPQIEAPAAPQAVQEPPRDAAPAEGAASGGMSRADLLALHPQKLRKMCRDAGLPDTGKVAEMADRLQAAHAA